MRHPHVVAWVVAAFPFTLVALSRLDSETKTAFFVIIGSLALLSSLWIKIARWQWNILDEARDAGDFLVIIDRGKEEIVPLSDITRITWLDRTAWTYWPFHALRFSLPMPASYAEQLFSFAAIMIRSRSRKVYKREFETDVTSKHASN